MRRIFLFLLATCSFLILQAQVKISGLVSEENTDLPLMGVNVVVKGTTHGTITDMDGKYNLNVTDANATIQYSFIGYKTKEVVLDGASEREINIQLATEVGGLDEIVVIGYGVQRKGDVTSSIATVNSDEFIKGNSQDVGQLLQGKVAGLNISSVSGDPTAGTQIMLRGTNTIGGASSAPLILIDGIPGDFNSVAPEDVESIDILKDGSAAAIYGTKGANGVIIVTTKRASGKYTNRVSYTGFVSTASMVQKPNISTAADVRQQIADGYRDESYDLGATTDWLDQIAQEPVTKSHNVSFNGGNSTTNYMVSINHKAAEGIFKKSDKTTSGGKFDINHSMLNDKVKINIGGITRFTEFTTTGDGYSFNGYAYRQAKIFNPTAPVTDPNGVWTQGVGEFNYENPLARLEEAEGLNKSNWNRLKGSVSYEPIQGLTFKAQVSYSRFNETRGYYETSKHFSTINGGMNGYASNGSTEATDRLMELTANYNKKVGAHSFSILGGYSFEDTDRFGFWQRNQKFPTDVFGYYNIGLGAGISEEQTKAAMGSDRYRSNLIAFLGRATYNYNDRYLLMASVRHEAANTLLGADNPWGMFPALSLGWRISKESFMQDISVVNDLKLRVGYGITGSQPTAAYLAVSSMGYDAYIYSGGEWIKTLKPYRNQNPSLRWEERKETNIGLDFAFLDNRISGTIDLYKRKTDGLLFDYAVPVPPNLVPYTTLNVGVMENQGAEILLNIVALKTNDFQWTTSFNYSTNKNKLVSLSNDLYQTSTGYINSGGTGEPIQTYTHRTQEGGPVGNFFGFEVVDITQAGKWVYLDSVGNHVYQSSPGSYVYEDADGNLVQSDFKHDDKDKRVLGNGIPKFQLGWSNTFKYKNVDFSMSMRGAFGFQILNYERMYLENPTVTSYNRLNTAFDKVYGKAMLNEPLEYNSYYIEDGDYLKIDNLTLGYNFKTEAIKHISSMRIYASSINTITFTKYKGLDPEVATGGLSPGNDYRDRYPTTRAFTLGVNITF